MQPPERQAAWRSHHGALVLLFIACMVRLWLMPLGSSFWLDETLTAFVVHHGPSHPSLAVAPQVVASIYYLLPRASEALLGFSEISYRLPSLLAMLLALLLIARLAERLIGSGSGWFAALACFALGGINYQAADARPYGLGTCIAAASFLFLVRWLDWARWSDALLFVFGGALLWRVHLIYWPLYLVFALYAIVRIVRGETKVPLLHAAGVFALMGTALLPVFLDVIKILPQASAHAYAPIPGIRPLFNSLKLGLTIVCVLVAWYIARFWPPLTGDGQQVPEPAAKKPANSAWTLILGWWLLHPLCLLFYSRLSGNGVFLARYLSVSLGGGVLAATALASLYMPRQRWPQGAIALGCGALLFLGQWTVLWPRHDRSDWRGAARQMEDLSLPSNTPVICPSPFVEARSPEWRPDYPLPGFLYAHLDTYHISGKPLLLPFQPSREAFDYAATLAEKTLPGAGRFVIYGGDSNVRYWSEWFAGRPELAGWKQVRFDSFGDVWVVLFERRTRQAGGEQAQ